MVSQATVATTRLTDRVDLQPLTAGRNLIDVSSAITCFSLKAKSAEIITDGCAEIKPGVVIRLSVIVNIVYVDALVLHEPVRAR